MRSEHFTVVLALMLALGVATVPIFGQSLTTGNVTGTLYDPAHAVIPGAAVTLKGLDTGSSATTSTNSTGGYNFSLLKPGRYQVGVKQPGFAELQETVVVGLGQTTAVDLSLLVSKTSET